MASFFFFNKYHYATPNESLVTTKIRCITLLMKSSFSRWSVKLFSWEVGAIDILCQRALKLFVHSFLHFKCNLMASLRSVIQTVDMEEVWRAHQVARCQSRAVIINIKMETGEWLYIQIMADMTVQRKMLVNCSASAAAGGGRADSNTSCCSAATYISPLTVNKQVNTCLTCQWPQACVTWFLRLLQAWTYNPTNQECVHKEKIWSKMNPTLYLFNICITIWDRRRVGVVILFHFFI